MGAKNELWIGKRRSVRSFVTRAGREGKVTAREMLPRFLMSSSSSSSVASSGMRDKYVPARSLINGICLARCAFSPSLALASPTPFCCRCHAKTSPRGTEMGSSWQKCSSGFFAIPLLGNGKDDGRRPLLFSARKVTSLQALKSYPGGKNVRKSYQLNSTQLKSPSSPLFAGAKTNSLPLCPGPHSTSRPSGARPKPSSSAKEERLSVLPFRPPVSSLSLSPFCCPFNVVLCPF